MAKVERGPAVRKVLWAVLKLYGEVAYRCSRGAGYYWALRALCNWTGFDWYGRSISGKLFCRVGRIRW